MAHKPTAIVGIGQRLRGDRVVLLRRHDHLTVRPADPQHAPRPQPGQERPEHGPRGPGVGELEDVGRLQHPRRLRHGLPFLTDRQGY